MEEPLDESPMNWQKAVLVLALATLPAYLAIAWGTKLLADDHASQSGDDTTTTLPVSE